MLRVAKRSRGSERYYLEVAATTGSGAEPAGRWRGAGAAGLGLHGPVTDEESLGRVLDGRHPADGRQLSPAHDRVQVAAFDLTFCAPKSVSLLQALAEPEVADVVEACHRQAVAAALGYVERCAAAVRPTTAAGRLPVPVDGLVAAEFGHHVSRARDPHLHSHVVVANLGDGAGAGWRALDGRGLYAHRRTAEALYHQELRSALVGRLGLGFEPAHHGRADVLGVDPAVRQAFSQRSTAIAAALAQGTGSSWRATRVAALATRPDRDPAIGPAELRDEWRARARALGFGPRALSRLLDTGRVRRRAEPGVDEHVLSQATGLLRGRASVARRHIVGAVAWALEDAAGAAAVEAAADRLLTGLGDRAGVELAPWRPGVAEPRLALDGRDLGLGCARGLGRDASVAGPSVADQPAPGVLVGSRRRAAHDEDRAELARRLAARGLGPALAPDDGLGLG
jgi:conjugative relaxase-like TrwC/TraI family protein